MRTTTWRGQFAVSENPPPRPGWSDVVALGNQRIYLYPDTATTRVVDPAGNAIGLFIGTVIDYRAEELLVGDATFDPPPDAAHLDAAVEQFAYRYGGSWALVLSANGSERIHLDAAGSLSLVYDPVAKLAASTTGLVLGDDAYDQRFDRDLFAALDIAQEGWFPAGLTAHRGVSRLLCNHYLDLQTWAVARHWPRSEIAWSEDMLGAAERVGAIVQSSTRALAEAGPVVAALTGGNETRFLLAANRAMADEIDYITVASPPADRDVHLAQMLGETAALRHRLLPYVEATAAEREAWCFQSSHCVGGTNASSHPSIAPLAPYRAFIGGVGGEVGRAFFWRRTDHEATPMTATDLVPRFGMPMTEAVVAATASWLAELDGCNTLTILDLAFLELRVSPWAFASSYATPDIAHFHPLSCRESFELMLGLPPDVKRESGMFRHGATAMWPELEAVPVNRYGDYRDSLYTLKRLSKPHLVAKKLRKVLG